MESIESLRAKHAAEMAKREAELAIAAQLPFCPDYVADYRDAPRVHYRGRTLAQALEMAAALQIVPMVLRRGTFSTLKPAAIPDDGEEKGGPYAFSLEVTHGEGFGPSASLACYVRLSGGRLANVHFGLQGPDCIGAFQRWRASANERRSGTMGRGPVISRHYVANSELAALSDSRVKWASGGGYGIEDSAHFSYLFQAETEAEALGAEMAHAMGQLRNLADMIQPKA